MLFNSYHFIFLFLPITLFVFFLIGGRGHHRIAISWLVGASLVYYSWWYPSYLALILLSIFVNYGFGVILGSSKQSKKYLIVGIAFNVLLLGYFKYANFFVDNINIVFDSSFHFKTVILPLAISFFTFQQIAYLVDAYEGKAKEYNFLHYCLFVTFFPQLIAGPIVHHKEMLPQFARDAIYRFNPMTFAMGINFFIIGLFKKVVLADSIALYSTPVFSAADAGTAINFFEAWGTALAYTFQIYFDFSGYSDMAIGIGLFFGIRLPINFFSPYKASSIIDFWRRWHITLSRFLKDYLYIPFGGNRKGPTRRYVNIMLVMLIGGLWHGASWSFVLWGGLHGLYLMVNHGWRSLVVYSGRSEALLKAAWYRWTGVVVTFFLVVVAWVPFRASTLDGTVSILKSMFGMSGIALPAFFSKTPFMGKMSEIFGISFDASLVIDIKAWALYGTPLIFFLMAVVWFVPNTSELMSYIKERDLSAFFKRFVFRPTLVWAIAIAVFFIVTMSYMNRISEFIYFQF